MQVVVVLMYLNAGHRPPTTFELKKFFARTDRIGRRIVTMLSILITSFLKSLSCQKNYNRALGTCCSITQSSNLAHSHHFDDADQSVGKDLCWPESLELETLIHPDCWNLESFPKLITGILRYMWLMWTPPALWNHLAHGFKHWKVEQVKNYESRLKNLKSLTSEFRSVDLLPSVVL